MVYMMKYQVVYGCCVHEVPSGFTVVVYMVECQEGVWLVCM